MARNSGSEPDSSGVKPLFTVGHSSLDFPQFVEGFVEYFTLVHLAGTDEEPYVLERELF